MAAPLGQPVAVSRGSIAATVNATGSVVSGAAVRLGFRGTGLLAELRASAGQAVKKGDVLARLDTTELELQVAQARTQLAIAQAAVNQAESLVALKRSPYTDSDLRAAQAAVDQAQVAVKAAQYNLDNATLVAPFDGVVSMVTGAAGENVSGPVLSLVDPKALRVDVSLAEGDVARVEVGQPAILTFEALGGQRLQGKVTAVTPSATVQAGVVTYLVSLSLEGQPQPGQALPGGTTGPRPGMGPGVGPGAIAGAGTVAQSPADPSKVKPGMTVNASTVYSRKDNVLVVPNRAIRMQGQDRVVDVLADGKVGMRVVTIGTSNDQLTEILGGLKEGEQVLIPTTSTAPAYVPGLTGTSGRQPGVGAGLPR